MTKDQVSDAKTIFSRIREYSSYGYAKCSDCDKSDILMQDKLHASIVAEMDFVINYAAKLEAIRDQIFLQGSKRKQTTKIVVK